MLRVVKRSLFVLLCFLLLPAGMFAQTMTYEDQMGLLAPTSSGETGLFTTVTGDTLPRGQWSFGFYYNNYDWLAGEAREFRPLSRRSYRDMDIDEDVLSLSIGVGLTDRWEVSASLPYHQIDQNAGDLAGFVRGYPYVGKFDENGIGNIHIATKFALLDPAAYASRLALSVFVDAPTGDDEGGIATGSAGYGVGAHWSHRIFNAGATYKISGDRDADELPTSLNGRPVFFDDIEVGNELRLDGGINLPLRFWSTTNWISEINAILFQGGDRDPDDIIYLVTGIRHWFGDSGWALNAGVRYNVTMGTSDNKSCPIGGLLGVTYAPFRLAAVPPPVAPGPPPFVPPPPTQAPVPTTPPPDPITRTPKAPEEISTNTIEFDAGSARLTNIAKAILDDVALRMKQNPRATALVVGYTDDREATGANTDLDRRRAEATRDYLVNRHNIDPSIITVEGRDGREPIADNTTSEGRRRNRRVVVRLIVP